MQKVKEGYKITELGAIPAEWEVCKIEDVCESVDYRGKTPEKVQEGIFLITAKNIAKGYIDYEVSKEYIKKEDYSKVMSRGLPQIGDVLFTTEAPLGNVANIDNEEIALAQRVIKFRGKSGILENYYLKYFMLSEIFQNEIYNEATGSTVLGIKGSRLKKVNLIIPTLKEQQKISLILSSVDEKIEITDNLIEKTKELKKGLMQRLLTKGIGHDRFKDTEIGRIPEKWKVGILSDVIDKNRRITYGIVQPGEYDENGKYLIRAKDYSFGWVDNSEIFRVSDDIEKSYARARVEYGDVLLTIVGSVGNLAVVPKRLNNSNITQQTARLAFNNQVASNIYYYNYFQSFIGKKEISRYLKTGVQPSLNLSDVEKFKIIIPALKEQQEISVILSYVDEKINQYESKRVILQELKKGLMQKLLTGKIRVKV